jgi:hypothetical protein
MEYFNGVTMLLAHCLWANARSMHLLILQRTNHITYGVVISQELLVRWTLDVMHCEQNFAKKILKIVTSKKDIVKVKCDL